MEAIMTAGVIWCTGTYIISHETPSCWNKSVLN